MRVDGINLDLKNSDEQQAILERYKRFLNGLDFPIQILIRKNELNQRLNDLLETKTMNRKTKI